MHRHCQIVYAAVGHNEAADDDGAYDLHDLSGTPEKIGLAITESLQAIDLWNARTGAAVADRGEAVFVQVKIRVSPAFTHPGERCGECLECRVVEATKRLILVDSAPAGPGINDSHRQMWNRVLADNPCQNPKTTTRPSHDKATKMEIPREPG